MQTEFWQQAWEDASNNSAAKKKIIRSDNEMVGYWNQFAPKYGKNHPAGTHNERVRTVIEILNREQFLTAETEIIDIGCGPGTYSLPLAEMCKRVTALDSADGMCQQLIKTVEELGIKNIEVLQQPWENLDVENEKMLKKYDLAFASMTTAVSNYETLNKMNRVSRQNCCLVFWAENGFNRSRQELWKLVFNEDDSGQGMASVVYPFNLLYCLGYFPKIEFIDSEWVSTESVEDAVKSLCRTFWLYTDITPEIEKVITDYVLGKAENGTFHRKTEAKLGVVTWSQKNQRVFDRV